MDQREVLNKIKLYKSLVMNHLNVKHFYLFGSYAKGIATENSDIDVAIIVSRTDKDFFEINPLLWKLRRQVDDRIEPILIETDYDDAGFFEEIQKSGIEV